jgi:hypothetical protein
MGVSPIQASEVKVYSEAYQLSLLTLLEVTRALDSVLLNKVAKDRENNSNANKPVSPRR